MKYRVGEILRVKNESEFFYEIPWLSFKYPYCKIYEIRNLKGKNYYLIGSLSKNLHKYWGNIYVSDFDIPRIQDHFYSLKQTRKLKLKKIYGRA